MKNEVVVKKFNDETNRKVIHLIIDGEFVLGSYVDGELMNVNILNILLDCEEKGFTISVDNQWKN